MSEILGAVTGKVLALLGVAAVATLLWFWYSNDRSATLFSALSTAKNETWASYRYQTGRYGTAAITAATIIQLRALPESQISGTELVNDWGGTWAFTGANANLRAAVDNLPDSDCTRVTTRFPPSTGIVQVRVAGNMASVGSATANAAPLTAANAATLCANGTNAVEFVLSAQN